MVLILYFSVSAALALSAYFFPHPRWHTRAAALFLALQAALLAYAGLHLHRNEAVYFAFDPLGLLFLGVLTVLSAATFYHSRLYLSRHGDGGRRAGLYWAALMLLITAMTGAYFASHLGVLWIFIEATTLFVSILIHHERTETALEATWKYIFISSVGIALAFVGILFAGAAAQGAGASDVHLAELLPRAGDLDPRWLKLAFLLVLTGFSAKMGVFPLHPVCVDAHTAAPPPVSAFISTALMNAGFVGIFRVYTVIARSPAGNWANHVLMISGFLSVGLACVQMLRTAHFKRLFAFSSLEHMGLALLAIAAGGAGIYAALLHLTFHSLTKASLFYGIGQSHTVYHSYAFKDCKGYFNRFPLGGLSLFIGGFGIVAAPPPVSS